LYRSDRMVWGAVLFRTTNPEVIEGAIIRRTTRLHWTKQAAMDEVLEWAKEAPRIDPDTVDWQDTEEFAIGRFANDPQYVAVIRSMFLPLGKPPRTK
jgi:hypothetical protein